GEERRRDFEAKRLGGVQIDHQFELRRLQHGQIHRLGALENACRVNAHLVVGVNSIYSIAYQAASDGVFAKLIHRRKTVVCGEREQLTTTSIEEWIARNGESGYSLFSHRPKGCVDLAFGARMKHSNLQSECAGRLLRVAQLVLGHDKFGVVKKGNGL